MNPNAAHPEGLRWPEETRTELGDSAPSLPLPAVPFSRKGLLRELPPPPQGREGWPWTTESPPKDDRDIPSVSIVTPSYQQGSFIEETIRSVLLQNHPRLEYVVMDGGSSDETAEILEKYRPWLSYARSAKDRGQGHAINLGFSLAAGDIRGWVNSDDFYLPGALACISDKAAASPADFFYGDGLDLREESGRLSYAPASLVHSRYLDFGGLVFSHSAFWRKSIHEPIWEAMKCNVDGELWHRLIPGKRLCHIPRPLGLVRVQPQAKTVNSRFKEAWAHDDVLIWSLHGRPPPPRSLRRLEYRWVQNLARWVHVRQGERQLQSVLKACAWRDRQLLPMQ